MPAGGKGIQGVFSVNLATGGNQSQTVQQQRGAGPPGSPGVRCSGPDEAPAGGGRPPKKGGASPKLQGFHQGLLQRR